MSLKHTLQKAGYVVAGMIFIALLGIAFVAMIQGFLGQSY